MAHNNAVSGENRALISPFPDNKEANNTKVNCFSSSSHGCKIIFFYFYFFLMLFSFFLFAVCMFVDIHSLYLIFPFCLLSSLLGMKQGGAEMKMEMKMKAAGWGIKISPRFLGPNPPSCGAWMKNSCSAKDLLFNRWKKQWSCLSSLPSAVSCFFWHFFLEFLPFHIRSNKIYAWIKSMILQPRLGMGLVGAQRSLSLEMRNREISSGWVFSPSKCAPLDEWATL